MARYTSSTFFCSCICRVSLFKLNIRKKGTTILMGLLANLGCWLELYMSLEKCYPLNCWGHGAGCMYV